MGKRRERQRQRGEGRNSREGGDAHAGRKLGEVSGCVPPSSQPRQRTWRLPNPLRDEARLSKAAMHPGGQERALQPQTTATELELQPAVTARPADERRREGRGGEASLWRGSVGYQLSVEPGSCARPCRHRTGDELVWVSIGCLCASPAPPLALPCPAPPLVQISVLKGRVPPTSPHGPPPPLHQESSLP